MSAFLVVMALALVLSCVTQILRLGGWETELPAKWMTAGDLTVNIGLLVWCVVLLMGAK